MKKFTKILSVFMALLMVATCIPMTAFAQGRDTSSLDAYIDKDNLAVVVDDLLTALGDRKEEIVPTVLSLCFELIDALKEQAATDKIDVATATTEQLADSLINYLDVVLEEANLADAIKDYKGLIEMVLKGVKIDLNSVDGILGTLVGALDFLADKGYDFCGDASKFDTSMLKVEVRTDKNKKVIVAMSTENSSALDIVYALFGFLSAEDNVDIIKKVVKGNLDLGSVNGTIKTFTGLSGNAIDAEAEVANLLGDNVAVLINELLYDNLIKAEGDPALAESAYASYNSDELLAAALLKLITGTAPSKADAAEVAAMSLNEIIGKYGDQVIASFAIEPLNNGLKDAIKDLIAMDPQLEVLNTIINMDYEFTAETFNFASWTQSGLFSNLNNIVCTIAEVVINPDVYAELGIKKGGNENVNANLTSVFGYILKTLASNNGGKLEFTIDDVPYSFDFSGFTADKIAGKSLEDMVVAVFSLFYPTLLDMELPAEITKLEQVAAYSAYVCIDKFMVKDANIAFNKDYKDLVLSDGKVRDISLEQWNDVLGTMGMDVAVYWLNDSTNFGMTVADADALKAKGWTWEDIFEEIVDWALNYIDGIPAVADELTTERGKKDGSAWYKLNVVLNELLPMNFINGCGDETFVFDVYTMMVETFFPALFDCDLGAFANIIDEKSEDSPFKKGIINAVLDIVDTLLFGIFEHDCSSVGSFEKAATAKHDGYKGTYCKNNGHYVDVTVIPATGVKDPSTAPSTAPSTQPSTQPSTKPSTQPSTQPSTKPSTQPSTEPKPAGVTGDLDGNGKVSAADARIALRASAKLVTLDAEQTALADVDKNGKISAADARKILRVSAKLEKF